MYPRLTDLSAEMARERFDYDPDTGILRWKSKPEYNGLNRHWNSRYAGAECALINRFGYLHVMINRKRYRVHRLAYLIMSGNWPKDQIDHIDGNPSNNKWSNLRDATQVENNRNRRKRTDNTTSVIGVSWNKRSKKWRAKIGVNGKPMHLGYFTSIEDAYNAYQEATIKYFGEFRRQT